MSSTSTPQNLIDALRDTTEKLDLGYAEQPTIACITAYYTCFNDGVIFWRTSDEYEDSVKYRFYTASPINVLSIAFDSQLLDISHPMIPMLQDWLKPWSYQSPTDGSKTIFTPQQRCEFDSWSGLRRIWAMMGAARPIADVLYLPEVPEDMINYLDTFIELGLTAVRQISVDFFKTTVTLHFEQTSTPFSYELLGLYRNIAKNVSRMEPYGKIDLARILPKPVPDMERTLAEGYTVEITIDLADHKEEHIKVELRDKTNPEEEEEEPESESDSEEELEPMVSTWMVEPPSDDEAWAAKSESESEPDVYTRPTEFNDPLPSGRGRPVEERGYIDAKGVSNWETGAIRYITFRAVARQHLSLPHMGARLHKFLDLTPNYGGEEYTAVSFAFEKGDFSFVHVEKVFSGRLQEVEGERSGCDVDRDGVPDVEMGESGRVTEGTGVTDVEMGGQ